MAIKVRVTVPLDTDLREIAEKIQHQMESRAVRASYELYNASQLVLRGQRHGRRYKVPGTYKRQLDKDPAKDPSEWEWKNGRYYTASAPGEAPAVRTGAFRMSWQPKSQRVFGTYFSRIESDYRVGGGRHNLGDLLENGTSRMAPRPYSDQIIQRAEKKIDAIYSEPYDF